MTRFIAGQTWTPTLQRAGAIRRAVPRTILAATEGTIRWHGPDGVQCEMQAKSFQHWVQHHRATASPVVTVALAWDGNDLYAGSVWIGEITRYREGFYRAYLMTRSDPEEVAARHSEDEARLALSRAAIQALTTAKTARASRNGGPE